MKSTDKKGYLGLFGGFLIMLVIGTLYMWGNVNIYVRSYFCYNGSDAIPETDKDCRNC